MNISTYNCKIIVMTILSKIIVRKVIEIMTIKFLRNTKDKFRNY